MKDAKNTIKTISYITLFVMVVYLVLSILDVDQAVTSLICLIMVFYNSALRTEAAYLSFFALSLPFAGKDYNQTVSDKNSGK